MAYIDFMSAIHNSIQRDYLARVNDPEYPKAKAAELAKKWSYDYWDGDRRICYGGYKYVPGRWAPVAKAMANHYGLKAGDRVLDVGCGKGFQLVELQKVVPGLIVHGLDISEYAIKSAHESVKGSLSLGTATKLPFPDMSFDFIYSINTLHNLKNYELRSALFELERVGKSDKYICVESYQNEKQKANLLFWQVTCQTFHSTDEWEWLLQEAGYSGDHGFIFFD